MYRALGCWPVVVHGYLLFTFLSRKNLIQCLRTLDYTTTLPQKMLVHRMVAAESTGHYLPTLPFQSSSEKTPSRTFKNIIVKYCLCLICVKLVENDSYVVYSVEIYAFVKCCVLRLRDAISQGGSYVRIHRPLLRSFTCMSLLAHLRLLHVLIASIFLTWTSKVTLF